MYEKDNVGSSHLFLDNVHDYALISVDLHGKIIGWNSGAERILGYSPEEITGCPVAQFFTPEDVETDAPGQNLKEALTSGRAEEERWMVRKDGSRFWAGGVTTPMHDRKGKLRGFAKVLRDETARKVLEDRLRQSLEEKDKLLKEVYHRVRNNLNVVAALLSMQGDQVSDAAVVKMFEELQDRVRAIAGLHETLYSSDDFKSFVFKPYMEHLMNDLLAVHKVAGKQITLRVDGDQVVLPVEQALPLGLIVNELTTNAFKHAFPHRGEGNVVASLRYVNGSGAANDKQDDSVWCELVVYDDGVGLAHPDRFWLTTSMGFRIVHLLTKQLRGTLAIEGPGTKVRLLFALA